MLARILRAVSTAAVVLAAYFVYALTVVPLVEPAATEPVADDPLAMAAADKGRLQQFSAFFPPDAWELQNPNIIENPQFKLLLGQYESLPGGVVKLTPCTMIVFPDGDSADRGGRVLIMQAPAGALLQFDKEADLSRAQIGKLQGGRLVGEVTIRGNLSGAAGAGDNAADGNSADELFITTRDVELQPNRIWTQHEVKFRMGRNHGSGREMRIEMNSENKPHGAGKKAPPLEVKSLRLLKDVHLYLELESNGLLPGKREAASAAADRQSAPTPPMEVRCQGEFLFDIARLQATFANQVDVLRLNHDGPSDQLNAELLTVHFEKAAKDAAAATGAATDNGAEAHRPQQPFRVTKMVARGNPVTVSSPAVSGMARGEHLQFEVAERRLVLDGQSGVLLSYESSQIEAASVRYEAVPGSSLGRVWAGGPGRFQTTVPGEDSQRLTASWQEVLQVQPHEGRQLLSLIGGSQVQYGEMGSMGGDELWLWLVENETQGPPNNRPPANGDPASSTFSKFTPHLMLARGNVRVSSPQLYGTTNQMEAWFEPVESLPARAAATATARRPARDENKPTSRYRFEGGSVQLRFGMPQQGSPRLMDAAMTGAVRLAEEKAPGDNETPLLITAEQLQLRSADTDHAVVTVSGTPAHATARKFTVTAPAIQLDKKANRIQINGAGSMRVPIDRDLQGGKLAQPLPLDVSWQGQMNFDGETIRFDRNVVARTDQQQLQTDLLTIRLTRRVNLFEPIDQNSLQVARLDCSGGVAVIATTIENGRRTSYDRFEVSNLFIDQTTGRIQSDGAGWLSTVRESSTNGAAGPFGAARPAAQPPAAQPQRRQLTYIKVTFQRGIQGNLNQREIIFSDQVRCIYGPVSDWNAELSMDKPDGPRGQEVLLKSRQLAVRQMGSGGQRWTELDAQGNITVEGELFAAEGERMTYTTDKELMVLSGGGQTDARISNQQKVGGPVNQTVAKRFLYWQKTGRVQIEGIGFGSGTIDPRRNP